MATTTPSATEFSNIRIKISAAKISTWKAWWSDMVVKGNTTDAAEKRGTLTPLSAAGVPLNFALDLTQLGILRVSRMPVATGAVSQPEIELYVERVTVVAPAKSIAANASTGTLPRTDAQLVDTGETAIATTAATSTPATRTPVATEVPLASATLAPASLAVFNSADQGSRDPAAFPRAAGLTRVSYSGTYQDTYTSEQASYTSVETIYQVVAKVEAAAKAAGWSMTTLSESETSSGKSVAQGWVKAPATVSVSYFEPRNASGTQLSLQVYVRIP
jgi:hypothetical protein